MRRVGKVRGMTRRLLASVVALLLVACGTAPGVRTERADQAPPRPPTDGGSAVPSSQPTTETADTGESGDTGDTGDGVGDVLFPDLGNPGLDVLHYDVDLSYDSITDTIEGMVGLDAALTTDRTEITLDAIGLATSEVTVDGRTARAVTDGPELRITLPEPASAGDEIRIEVAYRAATAERSSAIGLPNGWFNTIGGSYVLNEPDGAHVDALQRPPQRQGHVHLHHLGATRCHRRGQWGPHRTTRRRHPRRVGVAGAAPDGHLPHLVAHR